MSCSQSIQKADVQKLNGYWENDTKLVLKNKEDKEYHYKKTDKIDLVHDGKKNK